MVTKKFLVSSPDVRYAQLPVIFLHDDFLLGFLLIVYNKLMNMYIHCQEISDVVKARHG